MRTGSFGLTEINNLKHKSIMLLTYSAGLRMSELINLKIKDIDSERMQVKVTQSRGKKDSISYFRTKLWNI